MLTMLRAVTILSIIGVQLKIERDNYKCHKINSTIFKFLRKRTNSVSPEVNGKQRFADGKVSAWLSATSATDELQAGTTCSSSGRRASKPSKAIF